MQLRHVESWPSLYATCINFDMKHSCVTVQDCPFTFNFQRITLIWRCANELSLLWCGEREIPARFLKCLAYDAYLASVNWACPHLIKPESPPIMNRVLIYVQTIDGFATSALFCLLSW